VNVLTQVSKADGCRATEQKEQQKQQEQQEQKQPKPIGCGETHISSLSPDPAGAAKAEVYA